MARWKCTLGRGSGSLLPRKMLVCHNLSSVPQCLPAGKGILYAIVLNCNWKKMGEKLFFHLPSRVNFDFRYHLISNSYILVIRTCIYFWHHIQGCYMWLYVCAKTSSNAWMIKDVVTLLLWVEFTIVYVIQLFAKCSKAQQQYSGYSCLGCEIQYAVLRSLQLITTYRLHNWVQSIQVHTHM